MDHVCREVFDVNLRTRFSVLCVVDNHRVNVIYSGLELIVAQFTFPEAQRPALISPRRASVIADWAVANLTSLALWIAQISALLLSSWALPFGTMAHVRVFLALEAEISHALWTIGRADAAADAVVVRWARHVPLFVPLINMHSFRVKFGEAATRARNSLLLIAELSIFMHSLSWVTATADEPAKTLQRH